jgi:hypothetical protein
MLDDWIDAASSEFRAKRNFSNNFQVQMGIVAVPDSGPCICPFARGRFACRTNPNQHNFTASGYGAEPLQCPTHSEWWGQPLSVLRRSRRAASWSSHQCGDGSNHWYTNRDRNLFLRGVCHRPPSHRPWRSALLNHRERFKSFYHRHDFTNECERDFAGLTAV